MANKKFIVKLRGEERERLTGLISKGKAAAKTLLKARILLKAHQGEAGEGWLNGEIREALDTNVWMVSRTVPALMSSVCNTSVSAAGKGWPEPEKEWPCLS